MFETFGKLPTGAEMVKILRSSNYKNGSFQNLSHAAMRVNMKVLLQMINRARNVKPPKALPSIKTDLRSMAHNSLVWFGHSSYLMQLDGKFILVDPVLSGNASPFTFTTRAFAGSDVYAVKELPEIDVLVLSHDHYDHMDHRTLVLLKDKIKAVVCPLGLIPHFLRWGYDPAIIQELDWWEETTVGGVHFVATPAKHFSGRGLKRGQSFWNSYVLNTGKYNIYIGGDSGYDIHFKKIGEKYGPFDLAILESGQYNVAWHGIHMMPEETVHAAQDLRSKLLLPVHWGKFALAMHPWDEPIKRVMEEAKKMNVTVTTPMIGEPLILGGNYPVKEWWM